jgi:hypothetical protein
MEQAQQEIRVDDVVPLMNPERLHQVVLIGRVFGIERFDPLVDSFDDFRGFVFAEFDFGQFAGPVLRLLQQFEQRRDGLAVDLGLCQQRAAFVGDAVNAAMVLFAIGVAQVMLHVADERFVPVAKINRAVRADIDGDRAKIRVGGTDQAFLQLAFEAGAVLGHLDQVDALETDDVAVEKIALQFGGKWRLLIRPVPAHGRDGRSQNCSIPRVWRGNQYGR